MKKPKNGVAGANGHAKRSTQIFMTIEVAEKRVGATLLLLNEQGFDPRIEIREEVPLGRKAGPMTSEEIALLALQHGKASTKSLQEQFAAFGKTKQSVYTTLNALKKKGKVKNISTGVWEMVK